MKWIEDILRAKLGSSKADANPSLDEELWNNIQAGLSQPANESGSAAGNSTGLNRTAFGVAALFIVVGIGVGLNVDSEKEFDKGSSKGWEKGWEKGSEVVSEYAQLAENEALEQGEKPKSISHESVSAERVSPDRLFDSQPSAPSEPKTDSNENVQLQEDVANVDGQPRSSAPSLFSDVRLAEAKERLDEIEENAEETLQSEVALAELTEPDGPSEGRMIPPMRPIKLRFPKNNEPFEAVLNEYASQERSVLRNLGIRVFGGLTWSDFQYTTDDLGTFSDHFHAGSSAGGGVAVDFNFKKQKWSVGLGWLDYAQRLEFEQTWQTEFVDPAGLISIDVDPISGDTLAVETGPVLVTASNYRHFRNYNHVNALVIPFEWRKEWLIARWTLGGGLGGQLLIRTGARGHSFVEEGSGDADLVDAVAFDDANLPHARIAWSPSARLYVGFQFQPEWRLDASVAMGFQALGSVGGEQLNGPGLRQWDGQLRTLQLAAGVTRFFELSRDSSVE
jgi:hypothetical protein